jgi:hypothetical protein
MPLPLILFFFARRLPDIGYFATFVPLSKKFEESP